MCRRRRSFIVIQALLASLFSLNNGEVQTKMYASVGLNRSVDAVKRDINDILQSGKYYCNEEIARELTAINNGLNHVNLDGKLLTTSPTWGSSKGLQATAAAPNAAAALQNMGHYMKDYKNQMDNTRVAEKQENEIRELHQWAVTSLRNVQGEMMPYTLSAADRIRQFGDHVGVTDRFTGYRNNLTRTSRDHDPSMWANRPYGMTRSYTTMGSPSMEQKTRFGEKTAQSYGAMGKKITFGSHWPASWTLRGYRTLDSLYPRATSKSANGAFRPSAVLTDVKAMNAFNAQCMANGEYIPTSIQGTTMMTKPPNTMSAQEQAGINTKFPGKTEYMSRYIRPPTNVPTGDFIVNPKPDLSIHGRPLATSQYYPSSTEYQSRYEWPDGKKIVKLPWCRKI